MRIDGMRELELFDINKYPDHYRRVYKLLGCYRKELFERVHDAVEALELATEFLNLVKQHDPETYEEAKDAFYVAREDEYPTNYHNDDEV